MTFGLRILPAADADVDAAAFFIAQDSVETALRFYDAVEATFRLIREHPLAYARFEFDHPRLQDVRKCSVHGFASHLVFFRVDADMVEIIRVLHGARDLPEALREQTQ
jgi:toxin ParE1/3/4